MTQSQKERIKLLNSQLYKYSSGKDGKPYFCPCLKDCIYIKHKFIRETVYHASKSVNSTFIALHLIEFINVAKKTQVTYPKNNKNQKPFKEIIILKSTIKNIGTAKITIGVNKKDNGKIFYCITSFDI